MTTNDKKSALSQKNFFLISFLPALVYWYLEESYPIRIAIAGGLVLAVIEIAFEFFYTKHIHTLSKFNFFLILFLGGLSLLGDEGVWFKLQPAFTGWGIGLFMVYRLWLGEGMMIEMIQSMPQKSILPPEILKTMEGHMAGLFIIYGSFMGCLAFLGTTDQWIFFKTIGFYIVFVIFALGEVVLLRRKMRKLQQTMLMHEVLKSTKP